MWFTKDIFSYKITLLSEIPVEYFILVLFINTVNCVFKVYVASTLSNSARSMGLKSII